PCVSIARRAGSSRHREEANPPSLPIATGSPPLAVSGAFTPYCLGYDSVCSLCVFSDRVRAERGRFYLKVYISSTYQDLIDHRTPVDRTLRRMGHDVIGMEQYIAEGSKPVDRCKEDVRSADAYVIAVAWRYGHVPGRTSSPPDSRSITEIELK